MICMLIAYFQQNSFIQSNYTEYMYRSQSKFIISEYVYCSEQIINNL